MPRQNVVKTVRHRYRGTNTVCTGCMNMRRKSKYLWIYTAHFTNGRFARCEGQFCCTTCLTDWPLRFKR